MINLMLLNQNHEDSDQAVHLVGLMHLIIHFIKLKVLSHLVFWLWFQRAVTVSDRTRTSL